MTLLDTPEAIAAVARGTPKRWTKAEFNREVGRGWLEGQRVFLYRGRLFQMPMMGRPHQQGVKRLGYWLGDTFRPEFEVRTQLPFELPDDSVVLPDGVVVTAEQDAREPQPAAAVLVVEVSDSSLDLDRDLAADYAAAGVPEYWVDNVRDHEVEAYRRPEANTRSATGFRYAERRVYRRGDSVVSLARPDVAVSVDWLTGAV